MARPYVFFFALAVPTIAAACFPDFGIGESASGDGGTSDGSSNDGSSNDGTSPFDAASSTLVPQGQFVFTDPSGTSMTTATLSHDTWFDTHELTVATLRAWIAAAKPAPCTTGTCSLDPGGPYANKIVWYAAWNQAVAAEDYKSTSCQASGSSFQGYPTYNGTDDAMPINCVNWYQAASLCWFDGQKRLATQVEWQYAATGRGRGRTYPWGDTPAPSDCTHAIWRNDAGSQDDFNGCLFPVHAGSAPMGASFDGVQDMSGSVAEWTWDWYGSSYPNSWPVDYAGPAEDAGNLFDKMVRGGNWDSPDFELHTDKISNHQPANSFGDIGVRCVKTKL
jgi:hypothetical protein